MERKKSFWKSRKKAVSVKMAHVLQDEKAVNQLLSSIHDVRGQMKAGATPRVKLQPDVAKLVK